ncbi:MAG: 30S ribosomal protein S9 [Candidatus Niyogibacteria bacterium]|nr:30S ribosomal protein S9 [Candidatus Niyogibacteria bacterium]
MAATKKIKEKKVKPLETIAAEIPVAVAAVEAPVGVVPTDPSEILGIKKDPAVSVRSFEGYVGAIGRRKTSRASARIATGKGITVNRKDYKEYFPTEELQLHVEAPFKALKLTDKFSVSILVEGGGIHSQAEAVRHAISRALVRHEPELRKTLKRLGFLKRDPRAKERRKFGLKKARKAPQWAKR